MIGAQIGQPVPAKNAFDPDNDVFDKRENQLEKAFRVGFDIQVDDHFAFTCPGCRHTFSWHADRHRSNTCAADCKIS